MVLLNVEEKPPLSNLKFSPVGSSPYTSMRGVHPGLHNGFKP